MLKISLTSLTVLFNLMVNAQLNTLHYQQIKTSESHIYEDIIKHKKGEGYSYAVFYVANPLGKGEFTVTQLDVNLKKIRQKKFQFKWTKNGGNYFTFITFNGGLYAFEAITTKEFYSCSIQKLNETTLEKDGSQIELIQVPVKEKISDAVEQYYARAEIVISPNDEYLAVKMPNGEVCIVDDQLNKVVTTNTTSSTYGLKFAGHTITDDGYYFRWYNHIGEWGGCSQEPDKRVLIVCTDTNGYSVEKIIKPDNFLVNMQICVDDQNNVVLAATVSEEISGKTVELGTYQNGNFQSNSFGYFFIKLDHNLEYIVSLEHEFDKSLVMESKSPKALKSDQESLANGGRIGFKNLNHFKLIKYDEGYYLVGERYDATSRFDFQEGLQVNVYFGSILVLELTSNGELRNTSLILRKQTSNLNGGFVSYNVDGNLYLIINDHQDNEKVDNENEVVSTHSKDLDIYVIQINGENISKYPLGNPEWEGMLITPTLCQILGNQLFFYASSPPNYQIGILQGQ